MNLIETELGELKTELIDMTDLVKDQTEKSLSAFYNHDKDLAQEVIKNEKWVNGSELKIGSKCEHILALFNPVAIDLRFVIAALKIIADLERIGDNAKSIAGYVVKADKPYDERLLEEVNFRVMTDTVLEMLDVLSQSFETDNTKMARSVFTKDDIVDEINHNGNIVIRDYLLKEKEPETIIQALLFLSVIRKVERVGDYVTNIAEEIIFYVKAKVIRHNLKKPEA